MLEPSLELLIQMTQKVLDNQREIREDVRGIKARLVRLETDVAQLRVDLAALPVRFNRVSDNLEPVDRRLELASPA